MTIMSLQSLRGTHDLLPEICRQHLWIIETARKTAANYGFFEMATPIMESAEVFKRTLGDASDIVNKEMYTFEDRGGDAVTLRPEGTAGIARAFISEGLSQHTPLKVFYQGPMFRYERPQKGRQRQFHQLGVELLGASSHYADLECLCLAHGILQALGIGSVCHLEINSIGDKESRSKYRELLVSYLSAHINKLSVDSQRRLQINPLRILDSKDPNDQELLKNAPRLEEALTPAAREFFTHILDGLKAQNVPYQVNPFLVRGLDYYSQCVFEFKSSHLGAQDAVLSGGRYDELISTMGGPATPGVGWAGGIERMVLLRPNPVARPRPICVVPVTTEVEAQAFQVAQDLRAQGLYVEMGFSGNLSKRMKKANSLGASHAVVLGPDELKAQQVLIKNLDAGTQVAVSFSDLKKGAPHFF